MVMTSRERVLATLDHREPDRVPIDLGSCGPTGIHVAAYQRLLTVLGLQEEVRLWDLSGQLAAPSEAVLALVGADVRGIRAGGRSYTPQVLAPDSYRDQWGTIWRRPAGTTCYSIVEYPLRDATSADIKRYAWPDGTDRKGLEELGVRARHLREATTYAVLGEFAGHILERAQMVRGFDTFLEDLVLRPIFAEELMERILGIEIDIVTTFLSAVGPYLDVIAFKDDLGTQAGPLISPSMFRRYLRPRMRRLIEAIRSRTRARIWFHSCGSAYFALRDLVDIGVEILNPVQVAAREMDTRRLKREFGARLTFWGAIDTQRVLPYGTPQEVEAEVRERLRDLGPGGGYVLASVHNIEADVPGENVWAMYRAAQHWGRYPLEPVQATRAALL